MRALDAGSADGIMEQDACGPACYVTAPGNGGHDLSKVLASVSSLAASLRYRFVLMPRLASSLSCCAWRRHLVASVGCGRAGLRSMPSKSIAVSLRIAASRARLDMRPEGESKLWSMLGLVILVMAQLYRRSALCQGACDKDQPLVLGPFSSRPAHRWLQRTLVCGVWEHGRFVSKGTGS